MSPVMRGHFEDADAAIVASNRQDRSRSPPKPSPTPATRTLSDRSKDQDSGWEETLPSGSSSSRSLQLSEQSPIKKKPVGEGRGEGGGGGERGRGGGAGAGAGAGAGEGEAGRGRAGVQLVDDPDDPDLSFSAALAAKYESSDALQIPSNRVMTRAQFELCQQQQEDRRRLSGRKAESEDDSDDPDYEEESEAEKNKELARQRARQEAHLSVYRQQMMKISGTDPSDAPPLLGMNSRAGSVSTSALPLAHGGIDPGSSGKNSDEEDEEVPLAILMAHGFPTKNRPPTRLSNASSQPNLRAAAQSQQDPRLPVFARHLPQDPYNVGASILNPMNRMSLALGGGSDARSVAGGSVYGGGGGVPPAGGRGPQGLVGEIVRAEEQKAARRGVGSKTQFMQQQSDPFKQDPFDRPASRGGGGLLGGAGPGGGGMPLGGMGMGMGMGGMGGGGMGGGGMGGGGMGMGMGMGGGGMGMGMGMGGMGGMGMGMGMGLGMGMGIGIGMGPSGPGSRYANPGPSDPSIFQVEAAKKLLLVQLILHGKVRVCTYVHKKQIRDNVR